MLKIKKAGKYLLTLSLALIEITLMMTSECHLGCFTTSINNYSYLILKPSQIAHCRSLIHSLSMEQADFHFLNSVTSETEECVKQTCTHMWGTDVVCHIIGLPTSYKYPTIQRSWPHWYLSPTVGPRLLPVHQGAFCLFLLVCVCVCVCVCDDVLAFGCMCLFVCACWEWVMWLWASSWICHAICLSICLPVCLLSLSALSSTPVWLLSDKCVVWEQVCVYMSSVSVFPQNQTSNGESLLGTHTHTHIYTVDRYTHVRTVSHRTSSPIL